MKANALALSLILILVSLAGCSGTDTEVTVDMDSEDLQAIIDDNRDDFLNNTTVVVFQEYHNNTTVVNQYSNNSTSNVDQSGASSSTTTYNYNGSSGEPEIFVVRIEWNASDFLLESALKRDNNFTVSYSYYDYATNDDRTDEFTLPCSNYYDVVIPNSADSNDSDSDGDGVPDDLEVTPSYWQNNDYYWDWWDAIYNNTIRDLLDEMAWNDAVEETCRESNEDIGVLIDSSIYTIEGWSTQYDYSEAPVFFEMTIPNGSAMRVLHVSSLHEWTYYYQWNGGEWRPNSDDRFWTVNGIHVNEGCSSSVIVAELWTDCDDALYGGWEEISLDFQFINSVYHDSTFWFTMYYEIVPVTNVQ